MKTTAILLFLTVIISNTVFSQNCSAWFWPQNDSLNPMIVHFYADCYPQNQITDYNWDFGDGNTSTEQSPSHEYAIEGEFLVLLSITTPDCSNTYEESVFVPSQTQSNCNASFFYEVTGTNLLTVNFFDESSFSNPNLISYSWDFGDGFSSVEQNPQHIYTEAGIYNVIFTFTNEDCQSVFTEEVFVGENYNNGSDCIAMFSFEQISPGGLTFQFYDASWLAGDSISSQIWDFEGGVTSYENNPIYTFPNAGEFLVNYTITTQNCTSTNSSVIYAGDSVWYPETCQALFWIEPSPEDEYTIQFFDFSYVIGDIQFWEWNFGDGVFAYSQNQEHTYLQAGTYNAGLTVYSDSCQSFIEHIIEVPYNNNNPNECQAIFYSEIIEDSVQFYDLSLGNPTTWNWDFGDGTVSQLQNPSHVFDGVGIIEIALAIGGNNCNCSTGMAINMTNSEIAYMFNPTAPTDILENNQNNSLVYPNPVVNNLSIIDENNQIVFVQIIDINGKTIKTKAVKNSENKIEIDISEIPNGVYILKLTYENKNTGSYKIIK